MTPARTIHVFAPVPGSVYACAMLKVMAWCAALLLAGLLAACGGGETPATLRDVLPRDVLSPDGEQPIFVFFFTDP